MTINHIIERYHDLLVSFDIMPEYIGAIVVGSAFLSLFLMVVISDWITKKIIVSYFIRLSKKTKNNWDDIIASKKILVRFAHFVPALIIFHTLPLFLSELPGVLKLAQAITYIYIVLLAVVIVREFVSALNEIYQSNENLRNRPIKGYLQLINILVIIIAIVLITSRIFNYSPDKILASVGAMAAVLLLVFKDTILGLTASIQLSANNMVKIGDWITMPSHNADGTVEEITLNTVKVQNFDKTITTIPTYALVSGAFTNWRGMEESGGRRIKRSINIDMHSVKFCDREMLDRFKKIRYISEYVHNKLDEINLLNQEQQIDEDDLLNARRLTNIGTFRHYLMAYLKNHPKIRTDMTFLVRQLQPTDKGIPMEIYVFSSDQRWAYYEEIQADIFDHILAVIPAFDLKVFQNVSGGDLARLKI